MVGILGLLNFALFIALIVGLVKPSLILRWTNKPTRLKVLGYWFLSTIVIGILGVTFIDDTIDTKASIENANKFIEQRNYSNAITTLERIKETDTLYNKAQLLIKKADSLNNLSDEEKLIAQKLKEENAKKEGLLRQKELLEREIKSIDKGIKFANGNTIDELQMDIVLFATWSKIIKEAEESEESEIKDLGKKLKSKVSQIQIREFPNLRKQYAKIVANKMWENDIEVYANGTGKKYINFTGGIFAANKNKKDFQIQVQEILKIFRFKQARYRWYKGEDEYTYYTIYQGKDSEPVTF
ncbi:hypothetical protein [Tenacibaculum caenipelagi]|uniref:Uncharacterized protein n=1 Tax=Tenacibaculum caenipelagi TaxID=1325435 RepID=A0A4R6TDP5_9FLAO|nr:hypothetical protein [Tenacibaculum caenipelagi]TDQ23887.1 hypothetical protein DFQ07_2419 [Tenacibaculum caenipelagi]